MQRIRRFARPLALLLPTLAAAQIVPNPGDEEALPRYMTEAERAYVANNPLGISQREVTPPPTGPVHCAAEYEPMDGILMAWEGSAGWTTILAKMAAQITTVGDADVYVAVDTSGEATTARNAMVAQGADTSRITTMVVRTDSIWMRDYGPRYIFQGDVRSVVDHTYNRPRPNDNLFSTFFSGFRNQTRYELPLVHGGGNYHLASTRDSYTTRLINNENPVLTEQEIHDTWADYQNVDTNFFQPFPKSVDSTQHIDMWMQVISDNAVMISDWPNNPGSTQDNICDAAAVQLQAAGKTVHRIPARSVSGTHYTYTNVVMCNDLVIVPRYTNASVSGHNAPAKAAWEAALPGKTIVQVNAQAIVTAAGVFHCIVMHVPAHRGGAAPTAYLVGPNGGEVLAGGGTRAVRWVSDDDNAVSSVDLRLSLDGGLSYPTLIASGLAPRGVLNWAVPTTSSSQARIQVVAYDADGNSGTDASDADFTLQGTEPLAASITYGAGKPGTLGIPTLTSDLPILGGRVTLDLASALPNGLVGLLYGFSTASIPFDGATILVNGGSPIFLPISAAGTLTIPINVPSNVALAGFSVYWQAWVQNDPAAAGMGWAASAGLETRLGL